MTGEFFWGIGSRPFFIGSNKDPLHYINKLWFILLVFLLGIIEGVSQERKASDSLRQIIATTDDDDTKIRAYEGFYRLYINSYPDSVQYYSAKGLDLAHKIQDLGGVAHFSVLIAYIYYEQGSFKEAHQTLDKALAAVQGNPEQLADELRLLNWKAIVLQGQRKIDSAHTILSKIVEISEDHPKDRLSAYLILGNIALRRLEFQKGLRYYHKVDSICISNDFDYSACNSAIANSGMVLLEIGELEKSLEYIRKAQDNHINGGNTTIAIGLNDDVAKIYLKQGKYQLAEELLLESTDYLKKYKAPKLEVQSLKVLAEVYQDQSQLEKARPVLDRALELSQKIGDTISIAEIYIDYGELFTEKKDFKRAQSYSEKVLALLDESHQIGLLNEFYQIEYRLEVLKILVAVEVGKGNFKRAFALKEELEILKDELNTIKDKRDIAEVEAKYQTEKKEQEIELLTSQTLLATQKTKNQRNLFIAGISVLALALITLFVLFRNKQKTNKRLRELESAKSKFFANISHEFRTPLTLISGPVAHQLSKDNLSIEDRTDLGLIQRNANRLLKLVDQILDLSKIEAGRRKPRISQGNLELFLKNLVEPFEYQASQKDMTFKSLIDIPKEVWFDRDVVEKVVSNLLSNALKYNQPKGKIDFKAELKDQTVEINVSNQNTDLTEKQLPFLFDRFYQTNAFEQGFGIGLSLVKELVQLAHGTIKAQKPDEKNISFVVTLPIAKNVFSKDDLIIEEALPATETAYGKINLGDPIREEELIDDSLPVLLIVDDNEEIRLFIKTLFKKEYQIVEGQNGQAGIELAFKTIPDLIISDIMMPVKSGIDLSNTLKKDERTSHIPIVLLTAKSGEENELTGLKAGADAYIVKPFKEEKLRVIIKKLIATRETIRKKLNEQAIIRPKEVELTSADTRLLNRVQQILDSELTNPDFNAQRFAEQVGLSRMQLHRKLKALTGLSTSEFIRTQRLKLAAKLLKEGHDNISEIGYAVGFNQPAYFSTAFKQHFGYSPTEYMTVD